MSQSTVKLLRKDEKEKYKSYLPQYLKLKGFDYPIGKLSTFPFIRDETTPSMQCNNDCIYDYGSDKNFDIFDCIEKIEGITDFKNQLEYAKNIFGFTEHKPVIQDIKPKKEFTPDPKAISKVIDFILTQNETPEARKYKKFFSEKRGYNEDFSNYFGYYPGFDIASKSIGKETLINAGLEKWLYPGLVLRFYNNSGLKYIAYRDGKTFKYNSEGSKHNIYCLNRKLPDNEIIIITESEIDAICLLMNGLNNVISFSGINGACTENNLFIYNKYKEIIILFDNDIAGKNGSQKTAEKLKNKYPDKIIKIASLPDNQEGLKDTDDFNKAGKFDIIKNCIDNAVIYEPITESIPEKELNEDDKNKFDKNKFLALIDKESIRKIKLSLGKEITTHDIIDNDQNLKKLIALDEADHSIIIPDRFKGDYDFFTVLVKKYFKENYGFKLSRVDCDEIILYWANQYRKHSIIDFIENLKLTLNNPLQELIKFITFKKTSNYNMPLIAWEILNLFFTKHLLKIYANVQGKEYVNDCVPILMGLQGIGKSILVKQLSLDPHRYYCDISSTGRDNLNDKDNFMVISKKLIAELSELKAIKGKDDVESIKAFISRSFDEFRQPYGKHLIKINRTCSFIGTCNPDEIFMDSENRRFYPLDIETIDYEKIIENPEIIKSIYAYYRDFAKKILKENDFIKTSFQINILSNDSNNYLRESRKEKRISNVYEDKIQKWVNDKTEKHPEIIKNEKAIGKIELTKLYFSCAECKQEVFSFGHIPSNIHKVFSTVMRENGFYENREYINGKQQRVWKKTEEKLNYD